MRTKAKNWLDSELLRLSQINSDLFEGDGYLALCVCFMAQVKMAYELGWLHAEQANGYNDMVEYLISTVRPDLVV